MCSGISAGGGCAHVDVPRSVCTVLVLAGKEAGSRAYVSVLFHDNLAGFHGDNYVVTN